MDETSIVCPDWIIVTLDPAFIFTLPFKAVASTEK